MLECEPILESLLNKKRLTNSSAAIYYNKLCPVAIVEFVEFCYFRFSTDYFAHTHYNLP